MEIKNKRIRVTLSNKIECKIFDYKNNKIAHIETDFDNAFLHIGNLLDTIITRNKEFNTIIIQNLTNDKKSQINS